MANKTDAGNGSKAICRVSHVLRSPSPDPGRSPKAPSPMTTEQAIQCYRVADENLDGCSCFAITPRLIRPGQYGPLTDAHLELITALDGGFADAVPAENSFTVYRGAPSEFVNIVRASADGVYPSFVSTSRQIGEAVRFLPPFRPKSALLRISCPVGTRFLDVSGVGIGTLEQAEVLLPRASRFTVTAWTPTDLTESERLLVEMCPADEYFHLDLII